MSREQNKFFNIFFMLTLIVLIISVGCGCNKTTSESSQPKTERIVVTDVAGREVEIKGPVKKVIVNWSGGGGAFMTMSALLGEEVGDYIVGWGNSLPDYRFDMYEHYRSIVPKLNDIVNVGNVEKGTFNTELALSLKPDLVILTLSVQEQAKKNIEPALEQAGIPIVYIDYHKGTMENHIASTRLLGKIFGKEKRAEDIVNFYSEKANEVTNRLSKITKEKPTVYIECAMEGPSKYGNSYGDNYMWGAVASKAGGQNIGSGVLMESEPINPEYLIKSDPDFIIFTGSYWPSNPDSLRMGYLSSQEESQNLLRAFMKRPGWQELKAVKNKNVYAIHHSIAREMYDIVALEFFAKIFYPEEFADIDPMADLQDYYDRFLPYDLEGVWMMKME